MFWIFSSAISMEIIFYASPVLRSNSEFCFEGKLNHNNNRGRASSSFSLLLCFCDIHALHETFSHWILSKKRCRRSICTGVFFVPIGHNWNHIDIPLFPAGAISLSGVFKAPLCASFSTGCELTLHAYITKHLVWLIRFIAWLHSYWSYL